MTEHWSDQAPIYQQLRDRTLANILAGHLKEGDLLPSVRQVAIDLQINPLTASKAYQMLVDEGLVVAERGVGMRIKQGAHQQILEQQRMDFISKEWPAIVERMQRLGISLDDLPMPQNKKASNS